MHTRMNLVRQIMASHGYHRSRCHPHLLPPRNRLCYQSRDPASWDRLSNLQVNLDPLARPITLLAHALSPFLRRTGWYSGIMPTSRPTALSLERLSPHRKASHKALMGEPYIGELEPLRAFCTLFHRWVDLSSRTPYSYGVWKGHVRKTEKQSVPSCQTLYNLSLFSPHSLPDRLTYFSSSQQPPSHWQHRRR
jgi:hypothetical protein